MAASGKKVDQTAQDSTTGPTQPIGTRGARMADTVASGPNDLGPAAAPGRSPGGNRGPRARQSGDGRSAR